MIYFLIYIVYAYIGVWWTQVCLNMMPQKSGLDFDNYDERGRFFAIWAILYHAAFWPVSVVYMFFKADWREVLTAISEFNWSMTFRR